MSVFIINIGQVSFFLAKTEWIDVSMLPYTIVIANALIKNYDWYMAAEIYNQCGMYINIEDIGLYLSNNTFI